MGVRSAQCLVCGSSLNTQQCVLGALLLLLCSGRALAADAFPGDAHLRDYFLTKRGLGLYFNDNIAKLSISSVRTSSRRVLLLCLLHSSMQRCCCHGGRRALTS